MGDTHKNVINIFAAALIAAALSALGYIVMQQNRLSISIAELIIKNEDVFVKQESQIELINYLSSDIDELKSYKQEHDGYSVEAMKFILEKIKNVNTKSDERYAQVMNHVNEIKKYCYKSMEKN